MTTPARQAEADKAVKAFHLALTQIGVQTVAEALKLWEEVPATRKAATAGAWLEKAVDLVLRQRGLSRELAIAFYRLVRALHTGKTIPNPLDPEPKAVTLTELRREFARLAERTYDTDPDRDTDEPQEGSGGNAGPRDESDSEDDVPLEDEADYQAELAALERDAEEEARTVLEALGPKNQQRLEEALDKERKASEVDAERDEIHRRAGARQAAAAARLAEDGGRSANWAIANRDKRVFGWARISETGTPCGWCAMLISRGAVYRTESSAEYSDGDKYHDNCHCVAIQLFVKEKLSDSPLFDLNRKYAVEWKAVITDKGLRGKAAMTAWRHYIRQQQKDARDQAS